jgi:tetratricopeptide (TPR) repeat protein
MANAVTLMRRAARARRDDRPLDAHRDYAAAVAICRQTGVPRELVQALKGLGQIERDLGHGDTARPLYEEAVAICRGLDDPLILAHTVRHLGDIHQDAGRAEMAAPCYHEALELYRGNEQTPPADLANTAILTDDGGRVEEAKRLWEEARDLYAAANVPEGVAESSARLARLNR